MRDDMFKVIVERPRRGWRSAPRMRGRLAGEDDLPTKIGMKRHIAVTRQKTKWLNENLQPLKRYLGRQIGRKWDDVYSEISATLDPGHTVKRHVRQHLDDFVARITIGRHGEWMSVSDRGRFLQTLPWFQPYFVDPEDGRLKDSAAHWKALGIDPRAWRRRPAPETDPNVRVLDAMRELRCVDGVWYEIGYRIDPAALAWVFDLVERALAPASKRHAVTKRQLSRAELKLFGLANSQPD